MIVLTKLDDKRILLNLDTVKYFESVPDTIVQFINGESVLVKESMEQVSKAIIDYKSRVLTRSADNEAQ